MLGVLGVFAQLERDNFSERSMEGRRMAASKGNHSGGTISYGYTVNPETKALEIHPTEGDIVRRMFQWAADGVTTQQIALRLNAMGVPTKFRGRRGGRTFTALWHPATVNTILHHRAYTGVWDYGREARKPRDRRLTAGTRPALVSEELYMRAIERVKANRKMSKRNTKRFYLLSGLVRCDCGHAYCGLYYDLADGSEVRYYRCSRQRPNEPCGAPNIRADEIEPLVWADVREFLGRRENVIGAIEAMHASEDGSDLSGELERVDARLAALKEEESRLVDLYTAGMVSREVLDGKAGRIEAERRGALAVREQVQRERADANARRLHLQSIEQNLRALAEGLDSATPEQQREVIRALVASITIRKDRTIQIKYVYGQPSGVIAMHTSRAVP